MTNLNRELTEEEIKETRKTIDDCYKRQNSILNVQIGDEEYIPTEEELKKAIADADETYLKENL